MKTIGILATIAALLVTVSTADARHYRGYGSGSSAYPHYDRAGGPSYGGM
jgi:hypothetical protein